jgi:exodeoxyribonuclease VII large subunit
MQGDMAQDSVVEALRRIAEHEEDFDVVVIIRGGGSTSDLALFDSYLIASYVAQFPIPIFAGIGHDKDVSVVDMVAHTTCKTPTAVATRLVEMADYEMNIIDNHANSIAGLIEERLHNEDMRIYTLSNNIERHATSIITEQLNRMDQIKRAISGRLELIFASEEQRLTAAERSLKSYSIDNILRLGFAVARNQDGALKSVNDADIGNAIDIELIDGVIGAEIKSITPKN